MATQNRKTRLYEPWGYRDENNYESSQIILENDLDGFFSGVEYNHDDNKIHFSNKDGEEVGSLDVAEFVKSDQIVERAWYEDGKIYIKFTNGDIITIDVKDLIDENEFGDGLQVVDGVVSILKDASSEEWLTVSSSGISINGIQSEFDRIDDKVDDEVARLDGKIDDEAERATNVEQALDEKINQEIADRIADVDAEETRAKASEQVLTTNLANEITRATQTEQALNSRIDLVSDELDSEEATREANDAALGLRITTETNDRVAAVNAERDRAVAAEQTISGRVEALADIVESGDTVVDKMIEYLGYKDNDTLETSNTNEAAFGRYNVSNTSADASGQTIFSIGMGTSDADRKNLFEVRADGSVYMWVEDDFTQINDLLAMLAHEVYN